VYRLAKDTSDDGQQSISSLKGTTVFPPIMRPEDSREAELIERICLGERDLFHDLIRPYERKVYLTVLALLGSEAEAEDAAQETMIKAFRNLKSFRSEARFSTWLVSIALNEARSRLRKAKRAKFESLDAEADSFEGDFTPAMLTDWREIPSEALERSELRDTLQSAVAELPRIYREVFTLRDLEELNVEETARALGVTANVVKVRLHRARMLLQKRLVPLLKTSFSPRRGLFGRALWS
jgi:RNA polymerase sigma-70 factor, ECF subfamily